MPTKALTVGTTEIEAVGYHEDRSLLVIQNTHATNTLSVSDEAGQANATGIILGTQYASITLRKAHGEGSEKQWFIIGSASGTTVRIVEEFEEIPVPGVPPGEVHGNFRDPPIRGMR